MTSREKNLRSQIVVLYLWFLVSMILFGAFAAKAQDSVLHAKEFPGHDVGEKATKALAACPNSASTVPCYVMLDASLAAFPNGTLPTPGSNQFLIDFRFGWPGGNGFELYNGGVFSGTGYAHGSGVENNAFGVGVGAGLTSGFFNNLFGTWAGHSITTGNSNVYMGFYSGYAQTTGLYNACFGGIACGVNPTGTGNTGIGYESLANAGSVTDAAGDRGAPNYNTGIGFETCYWCGYYSYSPFTPAVNTAGGYQSQQNDSDGFANTTFGAQAMYEIVAGQSNTALGSGAFLFMANGSGNTCVGEGCGLNFGSAAADHPGIPVTGISIAGAVGTTCAAGCVVTVQANASALASGGGDHLLLGGTTNWNNGHITTTSASATSFTYNYTGYAFPGEPSGYYDLLSNNPQQNTIVGFNSGEGIVKGSYNTILGADVTGLDANLQGNIILADGHGTAYARWDGVNNWTFGGQSHGNFNGTSGATAGNQQTPWQILGPATGGLQIPLGISGANIPGNVGTVEGTGCTFLANNAVMTAYAVDNWHQVGAASASQILVVCPLGTSTYQAAAGTSDGNFATFWGTRTWTNELFYAAGNAIYACNVAAERSTAKVADALSPTYNGIYTSGGGSPVSVICDGANWRTE
jgi:hypothetical protein